MEYSTGLFRAYDRLANYVRNKVSHHSVLNAEFKTLSLQRFLGIAITLLGFILCTIIAIKTDRLSILMIGFSWLFLFPVFFWANLKIISVTQKIPLKYSSQISERDYLDVLVVFATFSAAACILGFFYLAILTSIIETFIYGIITCLSILILACYLSQHELLGIELGTSAKIWQSAVAIFSIPFRITARLAGLSFAFLNLFLILALVYAIYISAKGFESLDIFQIFTGLSVIGGSLITAAYLSSPLLIYLIALFSILIIRVVSELCGISADHSSGGQAWVGTEIHLNHQASSPDQTLVMSGDEARTLYLSGTMDPSTLAWMEGMQDWVPVSDIGF